MSLENSTSAKSNNIIKTRGMSNESRTSFIIVEYNSLWYSSVLASVERSSVGGFEVVEGLAGLARLALLKRISHFE
jgi:hypothetical protein